ncbi:UNVERIFIED_CONTAM: hypothetical protein FKN15_001837 [Acipenser sinensis]
MDALYSLHDTEKLGLAQYPLVEASIATLVQAPKLALLTKDASCPNKQCWVSEVFLKYAYSASTFASRLGNYNSILVAYQACLLKSLSESHRPSRQQIEELRLVNKNLVSVFKLKRQAVGRNLAALIVARRQLWLSQAHVPDVDKAQLLDAPIKPKHNFGPAVDEILQRSHRTQGSTKELVRLLPKRPPPVGKPVANWCPRPQQPHRPAQLPETTARGVSPPGTETKASG